MPAERELGVDPVLERGEAQLLEPGAASARERLGRNSASAGPRQSASASRRLGAPSASVGPSRSRPSRASRSNAVEVELALGSTRSA